MFGLTGLSLENSAFSLTTFLSSVKEPFCERELEVLFSTFARSVVTYAFEQQLGISDGALLVF